MRGHPHTDVQRQFSAQLAVGPVLRVNDTQNVPSLAIVFTDHTVEHAVHIDDTLQMREDKRSAMDTLSVTDISTHGITIRGPVITAGIALAGFGLDLQSEAAGIADLVVVRVGFTNHDTGLGPRIGCAVEVFNTDRVVEVAFDLLGREEELVIAAPNVGAAALHDVGIFFRSGGDAALGRAAVVHVTYEVKVKFRLISFNNHCLFS